MSWDFYYNDAHVHYLDFVQKNDTNGLTSLAAKLQQKWVKNCILFSTPYNMEITGRSVGNPTHYLADDSHTYWHSMSDIILAEDYFRYMNGTPSTTVTFWPFLSGGNTANENTAAEMARVLDLYNNRCDFKGIGELMFRHDCLTWKSDCITPTVTSQAAYNIFQLADEREMICIIHHDLTAYKRTDTAIYLAELEQALTDNPNTTFVLAHCGMGYHVHLNDDSGQPNKLITLLQGLINNHPNIYFDLSGEVWDQDIIAKDANGNLINWDDWVQFLNNDVNSRRFMVGTDTLGHWGNYNIWKYDQLMNNLPANYADRIAQTNFRTLLGF